MIAFHIERVLSAPKWLASVSGDVVGGWLTARPEPVSVDQAGRLLVRGLPYVTIMTEALLLEQILVLAACISK